MKNLDLTLLSNIFYVRVWNSVPISDRGSIFSEEIENAVTSNDLIWDSVQQFIYHSIVEIINDSLP